jgi:hypothetical protein
VGSKAKPKGMTTGMFGNIRFFDCRIDRTLKPERVLMVATHHFGTRVFGNVVGWKKPLPAKLCAFIGAFFSQGIWQFNRRQIFSKVLLVQGYDPIKLDFSGRMSRSGNRVLK